MVAGVVWFLAVYLMVTTEHLRSEVLMMNDLEILNKRIDDASRLKLGGPMRLAVLKRIEWAATNEEEYTDEQFAFWIDCLNSAAGWVQNDMVTSGIYRDIGWLLSAKGDKEGALRYYEGALDAYPETSMRPDIEGKMAELRK